MQGENKAVKLVGELVENIFLNCLFNDGEPTDPHVTAEGILSTACFNPERLKKHETKIKALLLELPESFMQTGGGGMSFLNACDDRHGNQWTGLHSTMDQLFQLGMAIGMVKLCLPRNMWSALPGSMPYYTVLDGQRVTE